MSATSELLLEKILKIRLALETAATQGQPTNELEKQLQELNQQLTQTQALNESKILKG